RPGPHGVEPARGPRLPCLPDGHGDRPLREFHHLRALAHRPRAVDERGGPVRGGARAPPALPRRPRESPAPQAPPHRRPCREALPLTLPATPGYEGFLFYPLTMGIALGMISGGDVALLYDSYLAAGGERSPGNGRPGNCEARGAHGGAGERAA